MNEFIKLLWRPLILDRDMFEMQRKSPDAFKRAFLVVVVVGLFVGFFSGLLMAGNAFLAPDPVAAERAAYEQMQPFLENMPPEVRAYVVDSMRIGFGVARVIQADRGKYVTSQVLEAVGRWFTSPIGYLAALIPFTLLVLLIARLLGGNASLSGMLGCTLLAVTPHLLDPIGILLGAIPCLGGCLGGLVGLITFIWSIVIYVVAVAIANSFGYVKSLAAILIGLAVSVLGPTLLLALFVIMMMVLGTLAGGGSAS
ncbi:MAG: YIP1 family protein [Chloroflexi bacterium]|nr:YIP1 family protein [Chloroflexota bacterium]MBU1752037.1 YIP1 family protein [Chloroflexota bacterium]